MGWRKIACHVVELDDRNVFEISLIENIQRKTLNPLDEGAAYKAYISEIGWGIISDLGRRMGKSVSYISRQIKLLNLPDGVLESIMNKTLSTIVAEELITINDKQEQSKLATLIIDRQLSLLKSRDSSINTI